MLAEKSGRLLTKKKRAVTVIGTEIRTARKELGLNQSQFAKVLGYSSNVRISELERGVFEINGAAARLIGAYLEGYRPNDWPGIVEGPRLLARAS
jgi:DNA-binding transcriptional regulator YiaG